MRYYHVVGVFAQIAGTLHLTDMQAAARLHALTPCDAGQHGENRYTTREPVGFKAGETFGCTDLLRVNGIEPVEMTAAQFDKRVKGEREAAAAAKRKTLAEREACDAAIRRASEAKTQAPVKVPAAKAAGKGKNALDAVTAAAGTLFHAAGKPA